MISMLKKTILAVSLFAFCSIVNASVYSDDCPVDNAVKLEGSFAEGDDRLHYESWMNEETNENSETYYFGRCIKNESTEKKLWTHWRGILGDGWIGIDDSKSRIISRNSGEVEDKSKQLWFGNSRNHMQNIQTRCWEDEKSCEAPATTARDTSGTQLTLDEVEDSARGAEAEEATVAERELSALHSILGENKNAFISDYGEVFLPLHGGNGNQMHRENEVFQLVRIGIALVSVAEYLHPGALRYSLELYFRSQDRMGLQRFFEQDEQDETRMLATLKFSNDQIGWSLGSDGDALGIDQRILEFGSRSENPYENPYFVNGEKLDGSLDAVLLEHGYLEVRDSNAEIVSIMPITFYSHQS